MGEPSPDTLPLEELFRRYAAEGDERFARALVERTRPRLLAIARRIGVATDAEDSVQTAYLSLMRKRAEPGFDAPILPWLITATIRIAYRAKASRGRLLAVADRLVQPPASEPALDRAAEREENARLRARVADLPPALRDPVVLHYFQGLPMADVGRLLDISDNAVKKRLQRARGILRRRVSPRFAAWLLAAPWWLADRAAAFAVGGLVMKKKLVAALLLLALVATIGGIAQSRSRDDGADRAAAVARQADANQATSSPAHSPDPVANDAGSETAGGGIVVTPDGTPVPGALVRVSGYRVRNAANILSHVMFDPAKDAVTTDSRGHYHLEPSLTGDVTMVEFMARAEGYAWTAARAKPGVLPRIELRRGIRLRVRAEAEDGAELSPCLIELRVWDDDVFARQLFWVRREEASFDLVPGRYGVRVQAEGFAPFLRKRFELVEGEPVEIEARMRRGLTFQVKVEDVEGEPIPDAQVVIAGPNDSGGVGKTDDEGVVRIAGLSREPDPDRSYSSYIRFEISARGHATLHETDRLPGSDGLEVRTFRLRPATTMTLQLVDEGGAAVTNAKLDIGHAEPEQTYRRWSEGTTDAEGTFTIDDFADGTIELRVKGREHAPCILPVEPTSAPVRVQLVTRGARIAGQVLGRDGEALAGGHVHFAPAAPGPNAPQIKTEINGEGNFVLEGLSPGPGTIWVVSAVSGPQPFPVEAPAEGFAIRLREGRPLAGVVKTRTGEPVPDVPIAMSAGGFSSVGNPIVRTDARGRFRIEGVEGERIRLYARNDDWIESWGLGIPVDAGDTELEITVKPKAEGWGLRVPLRLRDGRGRAISGPLQLFYSGRWRLQPQAGQTAGTYVVPFYDRPGTYTFTFRKSGYRETSIPDVTIEDRADLPVLAVRMERGAELTVLAKGPNGAPLANTSLRCIARNADPQVVRSDAAGRVVFGGFLAGPEEVVIRLEGERRVQSQYVDVRIPGELEVEIRKRGIVVARATGEGPFRWKLFDPDGALVADRTSREDWIRIATSRSGRHRIVITNASGESAHEVDVELGEVATVETGGD